MPVPCDIALVHGGTPPSKSKRYSQALNAPRSAARAIIASSIDRSGGQVVSRLALQELQAAFALPKLASGWIWSPSPG